MTGETIRWAGQPPTPPLLLLAHRGPLVFFLRGPLGLAGGLGHRGLLRRGRRRERADPVMVVGGGVAGLADHPVGRGRRGPRLQQVAVHRRRGLVDVDLLDLRDPGGVHPRGAVPGPIDPDSRQIGNLVALARAAGQPQLRRRRGVGNLDDVLQLSSTGGSSSCTSIRIGTAVVRGPIIRNSSPGHPAPHRPLDCPANASIISGPNPSSLHR